MRPPSASPTPGMKRGREGRQEILAMEMGSTSSALDADGFASAWAAACDEVFASPAIGVEAGSPGGRRCRRRCRRCGTGQVWVRTLKPVPQRATASAAPRNTGPIGQSARLSRAACVRRSGLGRKPAPSPDPHLSSPDAPAASRRGASSRSPRQHAYDCTSCASTGGRLAPRAVAGRGGGRGDGGATCASFRVEPMGVEPTTSRVRSEAARFHDV